jgi:serine protease Do
MANVLEELSEAVRALVGQVGPSVVGVGRSGSGVVVGEGQVLTNAHNLHGAEVRVAFGDGRRSEGRVLGVDVEGDIAVVAVDTADIAAVPWGAPVPEVGAAVVALAHDRGAGRVRASFGFVSATGVAFRGPGGRLVEGAFDHSAPLARGSSGGPVVDAAGRLLGIDTHRVGEGSYLAIVADAALRGRVDALAQGESPRRRRLGVAIAPGPVARRLRRSVGLPERDGLLVHGVEEAGPAAGAGVRAGDLIVTAAGAPVSSVDELARALAAAPEGAAVELGIVRGAEELTVAVDLDGTGAVHEGSV